MIPASNEPSGCLQTFGDCREGHIPTHRRCVCALQRCKIDAPLLAAGLLTWMKMEMDLEMDFRSETRFLLDTLMPP